MTERNKLRTGAMRGGSQGTRVHPDNVADQQERRIKAMQRVFGEEEIETDWAVVEKGRTIECPVPITSEDIKEQLARGEKKFVGYDKEGKSIYGPVLSYFGPGQRVLLPVPEIMRLRELGFLVDPSRKHNVPSKAQGHKSEEPHARVLNRGEQGLPGTQVHHR